MKSANLSVKVLLTFIFILSEIFCVPQYYRERRPWGNRRSRGCQSPYETFFNGQCLPIGSTEHCPRNMQLLDGQNNKGFCDCVQDLWGNPAFYSRKIGECSFHNTQGPCLDGEWFVLKNGFLQCEPVPEGCPADGQHFYGSPDGSMAEQCWEVGSQGPCLQYETLQLEKDRGKVKIYCKINLSLPASSVPSSVGFHAPCRPGTRRNRYGNCRRGFYG